MKDTLKAMKMKRLAAICFFVLCLAGLISYNALRPSQEEKDFNALRNALLSGRERGEISEDERLELRTLFDRLSPESKDKLTREILRERLDRMRERTASMSDDEKISGVEEAVREFRERFSKIPDIERERIKERINSPEGRKQFGKTLEFYSTKFSAKEREFLDPLAHEIMWAINSL